MKIGNLNVYGIIYKITNKINKKVYIGQTTSEYGFSGRYSCKGKGVERVYNQHKLMKEKSYEYNKHLLNSIEKYGFENFSVCEIFDVAFSKYELDIKEQCWIMIYDSYKNGYNQNMGGNGNKGHVGLQYSDNPMSQSIIQLSLDGEYIKTWDCISRASNELNIRSSTIIGVLKNKYGSKSAGGFLFVYKEEYDINKKYSYINKIGEYNKKSVIQLSLNGDFIKEYNSISEATRGVKNTSTSKIANCCQRKRKSHCGYMWVYKTDFLENKAPEYNAIHNGKSREVVQLSLTSEYIAKFDSITEASKETKTQLSKITSVCKGDRKTTNGFKWMYLSEYEKSKKEIS